MFWPSDSEHLSQKRLQEVPGLKKRTAELPAGRGPAGCVTGGSVCPGVSTGGTWSTGWL